MVVARQSGQCGGGGGTGVNQVNVVVPRQVGQRYALANTDTL